MRFSDGPESIDKVNVHQREGYGKAGTVEARRFLGIYEIWKKDWEPDNKLCRQIRKRRRMWCQQWRPSENEFITIVSLGAWRGALNHYCGV